MEVANYGTHGVILRNFRVVYVNKIGDTWGITPGFPGVEDDFAYFDYFAGYRDSLPKTLTVTWQLAELSDCKNVLTSKALPPMENYDDKIHVRKWDCTWTPIEGKVFHQRIDMAAIRASEAYQKAGDPIYEDQFFSFNRHGLYILFVFNEDKLVVKASNAPGGYTPLSEL